MQISWLLASAVVANIVQGQESPLRSAVPLPLTLDLRNAEAKTLVPQDLRDPVAVEAAQRAWLPYVAGLRGAPRVRIQLPLGPDRVPLLRSASQALKAQNPACMLYIAFEPSGESILDEMVWGTVEGGALLPEELGPNPGRWREMLVRAQDQFPGRPWTLWVAVDPGPHTGTFLGDGGRLVVPEGGPSARLARLLEPASYEVEGGQGDLTLRDRNSGKARRWRFLGGEWQLSPLHETRVEVAVVAKEAYDVSALLARMRATHRRDRAALQTVQSVVDYELHFQGERGNSDLGFTFQAFEKAGEPEELLRKQIRFNGVNAKLHGDLQLPVVEARTSVAAPVALSLTERYRYLDGGPGAAGQRILRFESVDDDPLLYRGELVVQEATGRVLVERSQREGLPGMVRSESRTLTYGEPGPGLWRILKSQTAERWMGTAGVGQVLRTIEYRDLRINDPGFGAARDAARASDGSILRQTVEGYRYFVKQKDGTRKVEDQMRARGRAVGGVVLIDPNARYKVLPLAGLAFFDFNAFNRNIQYSFLTAGLYNYLSASIPQVFGGVDITVEGALSFLGGTERPVRNGGLVDREGVQRRTQWMELGVARDLGSGFRISLEGRGIHNRFSDPKEDEYRTPGFLNPPSGVTWLGAGSLTWQHKGFHLRGTHSRGLRPWGEFGVPGKRSTIAEEGHFSRTSGAMTYDLGLGRGIWIHTTLGYMTGAGFDRFESIPFNGMVSGIKPYALAADRLAYGALRIALPTGPKLRLNLGLDHGRARSMDDGRTYGFSGVRLAGDIPGFGWFTTVRMDVAAGIQSDIQGVKAVSGMISLLRLF